jgi:hypothetical protein
MNFGSNSCSACAHMCCSAPYVQPPCSLTITHHATLLRAGASSCTTEITPDSTLPTGTQRLTQQCCSSCTTKHARTPAGCFRRCAGHKHTQHLQTLMHIMPVVVLLNPLSHVVPWTDACWSCCELSAPGRWGRCWLGPIVTQPSGIRVSKLG